MKNRRGGNLPPFYAFRSGALWAPFLHFFNIFRSGGYQPPSFTEFSVNFASVGKESSITIDYT